MKTDNKTRPQPSQDGEHAPQGTSGTSAADLRDLSRRVAEALDTDEAWLPADRCQRGHRNEIASTGLQRRIGALCPVCKLTYIIGNNAPGDEEREEEAEANLDNPAWRPSCRIPRGEPKPYAESLDLLVPVVEAWRKRREFAWWHLQSPQDGKGIHEDWQGQVWGADSESVEALDATAAEALACAFLDAVARWGR